MEDYDGNWYMDIQVGNDASSECKEASARLEVASGVIDGTLFNNAAGGFKGSIMNDQNLSGTVAANAAGQVPTEFTGSAEGGNLAGEWSDDAGCLGTWSARRVDNVMVSDYDGEWLVDIPSSDKDASDCKDTSGRMRLDGGIIVGKLGENDASYSAVLRDDGWIDEGVAFEPGETPYARFHGTATGPDLLSGRWRYPGNECFGTWSATRAQGADTGTDTNADTGADTNADTDANTNTDTNTDTDTNTHTDTGTVTNTDTVENADEY